jgi:hypothetical protein
MARYLENPDRNFSADGEREDFEFLRRWVSESKPALPYNEAAKARIGKVISNAVLPSRLRTPLRLL